MEKWTVRNVKFNCEAFAKALGISNIVARLLVNRDIYKVEDANSFLNSKIEDFEDYKKLLDMDKAIKIMKSSIDKGEKILIVGDYDVDGVISSYVLYSGLKKCNANVSYIIPDRIKDGYGINENIIKNAYENKVDLIITCDNGISAIEQIKLAKKLGIKVIITDHHDVPFIENEDGERTFILPEGDAVINPKQKECTYPFEKLCGAGVAYKFIEGMYEACGIDKAEAVELLQYVAIATVCDVVDLTGENRVIVKEGLTIINKTNNIGLRALFKETGLDNKEISVYALGFVIGPSMYI